MLHMHVKVKSTYRMIQCFDSIKLFYFIMKQRVVATGLGMYTPLGTNVL